MGIIAEKKCVISVGNFDGVHIGHTKLIAEMTRFDGERVIYTFLHHTREGQEGFVRLFPADINTSLLVSRGADRVIHADFDDLREMTPDEFVTRVLLPLNPNAVVCGENFRFGKGASGDAGTLVSLLGNNGVRCKVVPLSRDVSTTRIKESLESGRPEEAAAMLGYNYFIKSRVTHGKSLGRKLGAATLNQPLYENCAVPRFGVYASVCETSRGTFGAVTNIGVRPTVDSDGKPNAETHVFGFEGELYGETVSVSLVSFLRDERRFASAGELAKAIEADMGEAKRILNEKNGIIAEKTRIS